MRRGIGNGSEIGAELQQIVEAIEHLEAEKAIIAEQIRDKKTEAKGRGFDVKVVNAVIKLRKMERSQRREHRALLDLYLAALGDLDDEMSRWARKKASGEPLEENEEPELPFAAEAARDHQRPPEPDAEPAAPEDSSEEAYAKGAAAARAGLKLIQSNPYAPGSRQRIKFDEGFCAASGTDGFDLPAAWQRTKPPDAPAEGAPPGNGHDPAPPPS